MTAGPAVWMRDAAARSDVGERVRSVLSAALRYGWWLRPIVQLLVSVAVFAVGAFFLVKLVPGDPITVMTNGRLTAAQYAKTAAQLGLDRPVPEQLWNFLTQLAHGDLGIAISTGRPVAQDFASRIPQTIELVTLGLLGAVLLSVAISWFAVTHRSNPFAKLLTAYARSAGALPEYVIGIVLLYVFFALLHWAPAPSGRLSPLLDAPKQVTGFPMLDAIVAGNMADLGSYAQHLLLPVIVMILADTPIIAKMMMLSLDESIDDPVTSFRIATGASRRMVLLSVFRRASPPSVAVIGMLFTLLFGGALVVEDLFGIGGLGQYAVDAVNASDLFALRSFLVVVAAMCLTVYFLVDLAIMLIDPRRRPGVPGVGR